MNFVDLHREIAKEFDLPYGKSKEIMIALQDKMRTKILFGEEITLREIGTLTLRVREPKPFLHLKKNVMEVSKKKYFLSLRVTKKMQDELKKKTVY